MESGHTGSRPDRSAQLPPALLTTAVDGSLISWDASIVDDSGALGTESTTLPVSSIPALTVAIDEDQDPIAAGNTLTYTLRYGNRSGTSVTSTQLNFSLPANASLVSATGGSVQNGNTLSWDLATLPAGSLGQQIVRVLIDANTPEGILLESKAAINAIRASLPTSRRTTETAYVGQATPLALSLDITPLPAQSGQQILVDMSVTNQSGSTVFGGFVTLRYPPAMANISESLITGPLDITASCFQTGNQSICVPGDIIVWSLGTLSPGQTVQLTLPPTVLTTVVNGSLIPWNATASDDSLAFTFESETLPIGLGNLGLDSDGDGVDDDNDNCTLISNPGQRDTDSDNFGNRCDADLDNSGLVNSLDLGLFKAQLLSTDPDADFNGDGIVNSLDLGIFKQLFLKAPGPSGLVP